MDALSDFVGFVKSVCCILHFLFYPKITHTQKNKLLQLYCCCSLLRNDRRGLPFLFHTICPRTQTERTDRQTRNDDTMRHSTKHWDQLAFGGWLQKAERRAQLKLNILWLYYCNTGQTAKCVEQCFARWALVAVLRLC